MGNLVCTYIFRGEGETCTYEMDTTDLLYIEQWSEDYTNRMHFKSVERGHCWQTGPSLADRFELITPENSKSNATWHKNTGLETNKTLNKSCTVKARIK